MAGQRLVFALVLSLLACTHAIKLKFKYEECLTYTFSQYEYFYGSYVALPDISGVAASYDLSITTPTGFKLYEVHGEPEATFHLVPTEAGPHQFCLRLNQEKTASRYILVRDVLWNMNIGVGEHHDKVQESDTQYLWHHVYQIDGQIQELKSTLHFLYWREKRHRQTIESTQKRVLWYALLRLFGIISAAGAQVLLVRRYFTKVR